MRDDKEVACPSVVLPTFSANDTWKEKGGGLCSEPWYSCWMKKDLTISEFARMGGKARAAKLTKEQLSAIGKKGGRPRLDKKPKSTPDS
jgi:hypothetical protein